MGRAPGTSSSGLKTWYSSGSTMPCTTVSPRPQAPVIRTERGKPVSVSIREPSRRSPRGRSAPSAARPAESAMPMWSKLSLSRGRRWRVGEERGEAALHRVDQRLLAPDIEKGLEHGPQKLASGRFSAVAELRTAVSEVVALEPRGEVAVGLPDRFGHRTGHVAAEDALAHGPRPLSTGCCGRLSFCRGHRRIACLRSLSSMNRQ